MKNVQTAQTQKYKPGQYIVSLDHLMEQERIFFMGKKTCKQELVCKLAVVVCESGA